MITTVNCDLSLQSTCQLVNLSTCKPVNTSTYQQSTTNYANDTNSLAIRIRAIREIRSRCTNLFYISGQEKVRNGVEDHLFCYLCKCFVIR